MSKVVIQEASGRDNLLHQVEIDGRAYIIIPVMLGDTLPLLPEDQPQIRWVRDTMVPNAIVCGLRIVRAEEQAELIKQDIIIPGARLMKVGERNIVKGYLDDMVFHLGLVEKPDFVCAHPEIALLRPRSVNSNLVPALYVVGRAVGR